MQLITIHALGSLFLSFWVLAASLRTQLPGHIFFVFGFGPLSSPDTTSWVSSAKNRERALRTAASSAPAALRAFPSPTSHSPRSARMYVNNRFALFSHVNHPHSTLYHWLGPDWPCGKIPFRFPPALPARALDEPFRSSSILLVKKVNNGRFHQGSTLSSTHHLNLLFQILHTAS